MTNTIRDNIFSISNISEEELGKFEESYGNPSSYSVLFTNSETEVTQIKPQKFSDRHFDKVWTKAQEALERIIEMMLADVDERPRPVEKWKQIWEDMTTKNKIAPELFDWRTAYQDMVLESNWHLQPLTARRGMSSTRDIHMSILEHSIMEAGIERLDGFESSQLTGSEVDTNSYYERIRGFQRGAWEVDDGIDPMEDLAQAMSYFDNGEQSGSVVQMQRNEEIRLRNLQIGRFRHSRWIYLRWNNLSNLLCTSCKYCEFKDFKENTAYRCVKTFTNRHLTECSQYIPAFDYPKFKREWGSVCQKKIRIENMSQIVLGKKRNIWVDLEILT